MSKFSGRDIPQWVQSRILQFFNEAKDTSDLTGNQVQNQSNKAGGNYSLGETVAKRILERRDQSNIKKFRTFEELDGIQGLGDDKIRDLAFSLGIGADQQFKNNLYGQKVLLDNFIFREYSVEITDKESFDSIAGNRSLVDQEVQKLVYQGCLTKRDQPLACNMAVEGIPSLYVDSYSSGFLGSFAFSLWFMGFDEDNWFSHTTIHSELDKYLNTYPNYDMRLELWMYKGFQNAGVLAKEITVKDLPVVLNHAEQKISIWTGELHD